MRKQTKTNDGTGRAILAGAAIFLLMVMGCENITEVNQDLNLQSETTDLKSSRGMVEICHVNGHGDFSLITISEAAYEAHIAHGDAGIGDAVPGMEGFIFGENCQIEEDLDLQLDFSLKAITAGRNHSCGVDTNGDAYCWGANEFGQLGNSTNTANNQPVSVTMPEGIKFSSISGGAEEWNPERYTIALGNNGVIYGWGQSSEGILGTGFNQSSAPMEIQSLNELSFASIGTHNGWLLDSSTGVALTTSGNAYGWGSRFFPESTIELPKPDGISLISIKPGGNDFTFIVALGSNGEVYQGTFNDDFNLVPLPLENTFKSIGANFSYGVAVSSSGDLYQWHPYDFLGDTTPVKLKTPDGIRFVSVSSGTSHNLALTDTGDIYAWGRNSAGQLGDDSTTDRDIPVKVKTPDDVQFSSVSAGNFHSLAISTTGEAFAWGSNINGQLGNGTYENSNTPIKVLGNITFKH